jgi:MFS transporter, DHA1 family, multidrug resistance protein
VARPATAKVLATTLLGTLDTTALLPVISVYALAIGADPLQTGIIVGLYSAIHAPANFLFGRIVDRVGRRWPLRFGLLWDAVSLSLYPFATTPVLLALVRASHGLGGGLIGPSTMSLAAEGSPPERRGRAMAYYGIVIAIAFIAGPAMEAPVEIRFGIHALFYLLSALVAIGFAISLFLQEPRVRPPSPKSDWARALRYVREREPLGGYGAIFSLHFLQGTLVAPVVVFIGGNFGAAMRGLSLTVLAVASMVAHYFGGTMADRRGSAVPTIIGLVLVAVAMALVPLTRDSAVLLGLMALYGTGHGFVFPSASALVTRRADSRILGLVTGLFYSILVAGVFVGAAAMSAVWAARGIEAAIVASAAFVLPGIVLAGRSLTAVSREASDQGSNP